jgi:molecular chaperone IbpA
MVLRASHTPLNFGDLQKVLGFSVGFDSMFDRFESAFSVDRANNTSYPPYNIRREGDEKYFIELAIAGLKEDDLEVQLMSQILSIRSKKEDSEPEENNNYVHRGIAKRQFERSFTLSDDIIVKGCDLTNGMLTIELEKVIPEEKRARLIPIGKTFKSIT